MSRERELRDALEKSQREAQLLKKKLETLTQENELLKAQLQQARTEQERLTRLLLKDLKPEGQKSAFSVDDVPKLVAYLKKPTKR
jgi:chromosome segregation ATPase